MTPLVAIQQSPQPAQAIPDIATPGVHVTRIEKHFGDFYAICSCGSRSTPVTSEDFLDRWVCPWWDAQQEVERNERLWHARLEDAALQFTALYR